MSTLSRSKGIDPAATKLFTYGFSRFGTFGGGIRLISSVAARSKRVSGTLFPVKGDRCAGLGFEAGSKIVVPVAVKSPLRMSCGAMLKNRGGAFCLRVVFSQFTKK